MRQKLPTCRDCGRRVRHYAQGLCQACYRRARRRALGMSPAVRIDDATEVNFSLPRATLDALRLLAEREGITQSEWLRRAVAERAERRSANTDAPKGRGERA